MYGDNKILSFMKKSSVAAGKRVRFVPPKAGAPMLSIAGEHLLSDCVGVIVLGANQEIWCYPDAKELDLVWVRFHDDIRPIRQVSAAWLQEEPI
jgi:hypothetical protein